MKRPLLALGALLTLGACTGDSDPVPLPDFDIVDAGTREDAGAPDAGTDVDAGTDTDAGTDVDAGVDAGSRPVDPFADRVMAYSFGDSAGFGQDRFPDVVFGPPVGAGQHAGSLHVLSLGRNGSITLEFTDLFAVDGPGVDLLVFENAFQKVGGDVFAETARVSVSDDGVTWFDFACDPSDKDGGYPGCAGTHPVHSAPDNGVSPTDPAVAGGDGYDLADVGLPRARFVRLTDTGLNSYGGTSGGFDLDALSVVNGQLPDGGVP
ncbi:cell surface protein [Corallococcus aberystwythensis]|uniref:Cell surface protein n=1 Tax=Corallococcus aberystwythensis TaxID=2316722 RepID=A0A3A8PLQ4_9BACT|nr:cell surface protein [Corallococcus aberystwythensis]RKH57316.1 cell surface protein [Corallococcus aberystwythensis]